MSVKLSSFVWDGCASTGMKISKVAIMARLADFSSDEGICWPSVETIARQIGAGVSTVRTALGELEKEGWISKQQRRNGNRNASNIYQLNVEKLRASAQPPESERSKPDASKSDPSKSVRSESERSESKEKSTFHPPESGGDPSVNSKQDPSEITTSSSGNSGESPTDRKTDFISRHPDAVVYTPSGQSWGTQLDLDCAAWVFQRIQKINPAARQPNWADWANDIRLMREIDGRSHRDICELFKRANQDSFWCKNILSPRKLREQWDQLTLKLCGAAAQGGVDWNNTDWADDPAFQQQLASALGGIA